MLLKSSSDDSGCSVLFFFAGCGEESIISVPDFAAISGSMTEGEIDRGGEDAGGAAVSVLKRSSTRANCCFNS